MTDRARWIVTGALTLLGTWAAPAGAEALRTYTFEGTISRVDNTGGVFDRSIQVGSPFTMTVALPADTPNVLAGNAIYGHYDLPTGTLGQGESLTINGQPFPLGPARNGEIAVITDPNRGDSFYGYQTFTSSDPNINSMRLDFNLLSSGHPLSSDALPTAINLADFSGSTPGIFLPVFFEDNHAFPALQGVITSVQVAPVPEPGSIFVFGTVAIGLLAWRRRGRGVQPSRGGAR